MRTTSAIASHNSRSVSPEGLSEAHFRDNIWYTIQSGSSRRHRMDAITCRITFRGTANLKQTWLVAESPHDIDPEQAQELQRQEGLDPKNHGFFHFMKQRTPRGFIARW